MTAPGALRRPSVDARLRIAVIALALFAVALAVLALESALSRREVGIPLPASIRTGVAGTNAGPFRSVESPSAHHMIAFPVTLERNASYAISFTVSRVPRDPGFLAIDLYAPGYDEEAQERHLVFRDLVLHRQQRFEIDSGAAPASALLRFFYNGPPGLEISGVTFEKTSSGRLLLIRSTALVCLLVGAAAVIAWVRAREGVVHFARRNLLTAIPGVVLLAVAAALVRYATYVLTPYWSGDEYVYKNLANATWAFGSPARLRAESVSDSASFPNLLYPWVIAPAFALREWFYVGIRLINAIAMTSAVIPAYLIARDVVPHRDAMWLAAFAVGIPFMWLGAYATTEVIFYPVLLWAAWCALKALGNPRSSSWNIAVGIASAVLVNIRPNGFVVLVAYVTAVVALSWRARRISDLWKRPYWLLSIGVFALTAVALQWLLGVEAPGRFGVYGGVLHQGDAVGTLLSHPMDVLRMLCAHAATLAVPFGLPLAIVVTAFVSCWRVMDANAQPSLRLVYFSAFLTLTMLAVSTLR